MPKVKCVCKGQPCLGSGESKLRSVAWPKVGIGNATLGPRFSKRQSIQRLSGLCNPSSYVKFSRQLLPDVGESKTVLDSGFHAVDSGFQVLDGFQYLSAELGFWIQIINAIADSKT